MLPRQLDSPSARRRVTMRSLSTNAFGQPSETKLTLGAVASGFAPGSRIEQGASRDVRQDQGACWPAPQLKRPLPQSSENQSAPLRGSSTALREIIGGLGLSALSCTRGRALRMKRTGILLGLVCVGFVVVSQATLAVSQKVRPGATMRTALSRRFRAASAPESRSGRRTGAGATAAPTALGV